MAGIRFNEPFLTGQERVYLDDVFASRNFSGNGPYTKRAQRLLEAQTSAAHALLTHSCTGALELAAMLLDLGPGDEVILPSFTFVSTATAFLRTGAQLRFCEVDPATMTMDVAHAATLVTPRTRALVPVHYAGVGADMRAVQALADAHGLEIVEDAAQGLDATRFGQALGTFGAAGALSFHETKNVHCGLGGALLLNNAELFDRAEDMWERGTDRSKMFKGLVDKYSWVEPGSSFYPTEMQAAFLTAQLESLAANTQRRREIWALYDAGLADLGAQERLRLPQVPEDAVHNGHCYWLLAPTGAHADRMRESLCAAGVQVTIHYVPLHTSRMGLSMGNTHGDLPVTTDAAARLLRLPLHFGLSNLDVEQVVTAVNAHCATW